MRSAGEAGDAIVSGAELGVVVINQSWQLMLMLLGEAKASDDRHRRS